MSLQLLLNGGLGQQATSSTNVNEFPCLIMCFNRKSTENCRPHRSGRWTVHICRRIWAAVEASKVALPVPLGIIAMLTLLTFPSWKFPPQVCFAGLQVPVFPPLRLQGVEVKEGEVEEGTTPCVRQSLCRNCMWR